MEIRGDEGVFECAQIVMAALVQHDEEAVGWILRLPQREAVMALWTVLTCAIAGFDEDERELALQAIAHAVARNEATYERAFPKLVRAKRRRS